MLVQEEKNYAYVIEEATLPEIASIHETFKWYHKGPWLCYGYLGLTSYPDLLLPTDVRLSPPTSPQRVLQNPDTAQKYRVSQGPAGQGNPGT